jgi:hypothetical protein
VHFVDTCAIARVSKKLFFVCQLPDLWRNHYENVFGSPEKTRFVFSSSPMTSRGSDWIQKFRERWDKQLILKTYHLYSHFLSPSSQTFNIVDVYGTYLSAYAI